MSDNSNEEEFEEVEDKLDILMMTEQLSEKIFAQIKMYSSLDRSEIEKQYLNLKDDFLRKFDQKEFKDRIERMDLVKNEYNKIMDNMDRIKSDCSILMTQIGDKVYRAKVENEKLEAICGLDKVEPRRSNSMEIALKNFTEPIIDKENKSDDRGVKILSQVIMRESVWDTMHAIMFSLDKLLKDMREVHNAIIRLNENIKSLQLKDDFKNLLVMSMESVLLIGVEVVTTAYFWYRAIVMIPTTFVVTRELMNKAHIYFTENWSKEKINNFLEQIRLDIKSKDQVVVKLEKKLRAIKVELLTFVGEKRTRLRRESFEKIMKESESYSKRCDNIITLVNEINKECDLKPID